MSVKDNILQLNKDLPEGVELVAVSKTKPEEQILEAYHAGHRVFGENKVQELVDKYENLPDDIDWHFIGHLQTNKVKYIAPFIRLIHGVDSVKILKTINKEAAKNNRIIDCLIQLHIAEEDTKFGLNQDELIEMLESEEYITMVNVRIVGLMGMATYTDDDNQIKQEFNYLHRLFTTIKKQYFTNKPEFEVLSMGMSGDYKIAIECGSNMVRLGTTIFGEREYNKTV